MVCIFCGGNGYYVSETLSGDFVEHDCSMCKDDNLKQQNQDKEEGL